MSLPNPPATQPTALPQGEFTYLATPQEDTFAQLVVTTPDIVAAYLEAGFPEGASRSRTLQRATRLRNTPRVDERVVAYAQRALDRLDVREQRVMQELAAISFSDPVEFFHPDGTPRPVHEIPPHARAAIKTVSHNRSATIDTEGNVTEHVNAAYTLNDKVKALDMLSRIKGMVKDPKSSAGQHPMVLIQMGHDPNDPNHTPTMRIIDHEEQEQDQDREAREPDNPRGTPGSEDPKPDPLEGLI